ncbi:MAG: hypothetical protein ACI8PZ_006733 [Myxococcota bacterium]|jgi:hypothetical protein
MKMFGPLALMCWMSALMPSPAHATDVVVVLQWPATALNFADEKVQLKATRRLGTRDLEFRSGEKFDVLSSNRGFRIDLVAALNHDTKVCLVPLKSRFTNAFDLYYTASGPFWLVVPVKGKAGKMVYWRWRPGVGVALYTPKCERLIRKAARA